MIGIDCWIVHIGNTSPGRLCRIRTVNIIITPLNTRVYSYCQLISLEHTHSIFRYSTFKFLAPARDINVSVISHQSSVMLSHAQSCSVMLSHAQSCSVILSHTQSCSVILSHTQSCLVMLIHAQLCSVMLSHAQ